MYQETGDIYEGEWLRDKRHGQGIIQFGNETSIIVKKNSSKKRDSITFYFNFVFQQMETGMKEPGKTARRTVKGSSTTATKVNCTRAFGSMESQNVAP